MRIAVDGGNYNPENGVKSGIQRLIDSLLEQIQKINDQEISINYYYFGEGRFQPTVNINPVKLPAAFFGNMHLPLNVIKDRNEAFLGFSGFLPTALYLTKIKKVLFLHDLGFIKFPKLYSNPKKIIEDTKRSIRQADKIVVFSDTVKKDIMSTYASMIEQNKITRIYAGADHLLRYRNHIGSKPSQGNYFLYVGVVKPVKNIEKLFLLFQEFIAKKSNENFKLILIGPHEEEYFKKITNLPLYNQIKNNVYFIEDVSDSLLAQYYLHATCVLNFSQEEGFCYPVLEALAFGKPTIVNNLLIYKEYRKYFKNLLIGSSDKQIIKLMENAKKNKSNKAKLPEIFMWSNFTSSLLKVIFS